MRLASVTKARISLGERVKDRRRELGMTQQELAGEELTRGFISQVEKGMVLPSLGSLELIAARLRKPVAYFLEKGTPSTDTAVRERLDDLAALAEAKVDQNDLERAGYLLGEAQALLTGSNYPLQRSRILRLMGTSSLLAGDPQEAVSCLEQSRALVSPDEAPLDLAKCCNALGAAYYSLQNYTASVSAYEESLRLIDKCPNPDQVFKMKVLVNLGISHCKAGSYHRTIDWLENSLGLSEVSGSFFKLGDVFMTLGVAYQNTGDLEHAATYYRKALLFFQVLERPDMIARAHHNLGGVTALRGDLNQALDHFNASMKIYDELGDSSSKADAVGEVARVFYQQSRFDDARAYCIRALDGTGDEYEQARLQIVLGRIEESLGSHKASIRAFEAGITLLQKLGRDGELAAAYSELGNAYRTIGKHAEASEYLSKAVNLFSKAL